jgi:hypothetical protein
MGIPTPTRNSIFFLALAATMLVLAAVSLACPHARARRYRCRGLARARAGRRIRCVARTSWRLPSPWAHTLTLGRRMVDRRSCSLVGARESRTSVVLCCCPSPLLDPFLLLPFTTSKLVRARACCCCQGRITGNGLGMDNYGEGKNG